MQSKVAQQAAKQTGKIITKRCVAISDTHMIHEGLEKLSGDWLFHAGKGCPRHLT